MPVRKTVRSPAWWLLLVPAAAGLVLLAAGTVAKHQAAEAAMSAELLAPPEESAAPPVAELPTPPANTEPAVSEADRLASPGTFEPVIVTRSEGGVPSIVPPELVGALIQDSVAVAVAPHEPPPLDPALFSDWSTYEEAVKRSRETGRPVMLAFTAVGCETCESLRAAVFREEAASVTMRSAVIPVAVQDVFADQGSDARLVNELQHEFGVTTFPTLVVWSPTTKRVRSLKGYRGVAATLRFIIDAASAVD
jgi:thiol-disulfide isomerase/thioredoxin